MSNRKSSVLKKLQGTVVSNRVNPDEPRGIAGRAKPVFELSDMERYCYDVLTEDLELLGVLSVTDRTAIYDAAVNLAELQDFRARIKEVGDDPERFAERQWLTTRKEKARQQHRAWMQTLGLTPVDRARVSVIEILAGKRVPNMGLIRSEAHHLAAGLLDDVANYVDKADFDPVQSS